MLRTRKQEEKMARKRPVVLDQEGPKPFTQADYKHVKKQLKAQVVDGKGRKRRKRSGPKKDPTEKQSVCYNKFRGVVSKAKEYKIANPQLEWKDCMKQSFQFHKGGVPPMVA